MVAFTAIADSNDTSLAVVAPGIAEALATTAFGLVAAIPASIAYSRLGASFAAKGQDLANFIEEKSLSLLRANARRGGH
jgi:biopolymer transport protein ExbB/TolQ